MIVKGKSQKGKGRIQRHGKIWRVVREDHNVSCLPSRKGFLLESPDGYQCWMDKTDDKDFEVINAADNN